MYLSYSGKSNLSKLRYIGFLEDFLELVNNET